jgi:hypothetical protein
MATNSKIVGGYGLGLIIIFILDELGSGLEEIYNKKLD